MSRYPLAKGLAELIDSAYVGVPSPMRNSTANTMAWARMASTMIDSGSEASCSSSPHSCNVCEHWYAYCYQKHGAIIDMGIVWLVRMQHKGLSHRPVAASALKRYDDLQLTLVKVLENHVHDAIRWSQISPAYGRPRAQISVAVALVFLLRCGVFASEDRQHNSSPTLKQPTRSES